MVFSQNSQEKKKPNTLKPQLACKELGMRVKDCAKMGRIKKRGGGGEERKEALANKPR